MANKTIYVKDEDLPLWESLASKEDSISSLFAAFLRDKSEDWRVEAVHVDQRDETLRKGREAGIDDIAEKQAMSMCFDHPGMVYPRMNRHVFAEVKACIVAAILEALEKKGAIY